MSDPHKGPSEAKTQEENRLREDHLMEHQGETHQEENHQEDHLEDHQGEVTQITRTVKGTESIQEKSVATLISPMGIEQRQRNSKWILNWPG